MDGILPVYKPGGMGSYDVIRVFKGSNKPKFKVGHGGSLDPFAEGVLLLLLGKATKKFNEIQSWDKTYIAKAVMGAKSETLDKDGNIQKINDPIRPKLEDLNTAIESFSGEIEQEVPAYSAAKHKGVPLYKLAREGKKVPQKTKKVNVYGLELVEYKYPELTMKTTVSSGTYIRQLSYDLLRSLGIESYLSELKRERVGQFDLLMCTSIDEIETGEWEKYLVSK